MIYLVFIICHAMRFTVPLKMIYLVFIICHPIRCTVPLNMIYLVFIICHAIRWIPNLWELKESQKKEEDKVSFIFTFFTVFTAVQTVLYRA